ncbi:MAG: hypothetical protein AMXMBFR37_05900 [Steroidobacteraceae bacterium]
MTLRRQFELLPEDEQFLNELGLPWETIVDGSHWVLIHDFPTNGGYNHRLVTVAIRMETGYPQAQLDMAYFFPALGRIDGKPIGAADAKQAINGKAFQRWSRHRTAQNPWRPGEDNLGTHIHLVEDWLTREFKKR